mgnify:CR=1 FL=1
MNKVPKLLHIDTTSEIAMIGLSIQDQIIAQVTNQASQQHASFVQTSIESICKEHSFDLNQLDGIVVTLGPGSYTGMRVGLASAKGIAYALDKPLIGLSSLALIAKAANKKIDQSGSNYSLFSMIDARRMEVYSAIFDKSYSKIKGVQAEILRENSYADSTETFYFIGDCQEKCKTVLTAANFHFLPEIVFPSANEMSALSYEKFINNDFEDVAYFEPFYLKDFLITK